MIPENHFDLKMTSAQVVEMSVTVNNGSFWQKYTHPDDPTRDKLLIPLGSNHYINSLLVKPAE